MKTLLFLSSLTACYRSGKSLRAGEQVGVGLVDCLGMLGLVDFKGQSDQPGLKGLLVKTGWTGLMDSKGLLDRGGLKARKVRQGQRLVS